MASWNIVPLKGEREYAVLEAENGDDKGAVLGEFHEDVCQERLRRIVGATASTGARLHNVKGCKVGHNGLSFLLSGLGLFVLHPTKPPSHLVNPQVHPGPRLQPTSC
jgi:hypothetical protein